MPVTLLCDKKHVLTSYYNEVRIIGAGADCRFGANKYLQGWRYRGNLGLGVVAMSLGKKGYATHQNAWWYTAENIDRLLMERYMTKNLGVPRRKHI